MYQSYGPLDAFELKVRGLLCEMDRMADDALHNDDIGELRGQVRGLQAGFNDLGRKLDEGLGRLTDYIRTSSEKTEARIDAQAQRTDARFEELANRQLSALDGKSSAQWQVFAYIGATVLSLVGLGGTFYTITRSPIDANFADLKASDVAFRQELKELAHEFVPSSQVMVQFDDMNRRVTVMGDRLHAEELRGSAQTAEIRAIDKELDLVRSDQRVMNTDMATRAQVHDLNDRITTTSNRLQTVYDKNYTPSTATASPPPIAGAPGR